MTARDSAGQGLKELLSSPKTAWAAAMVSAATGLFFIFVWSPLPFGWKGFDGYYGLGLGLARGEGYPTMFRTWGYPLFLGMFYRLCGDQPAVPLVAQALLNALVPVMIYRLVRRELGRLAAGLSAVLAGVFSLSTVYASTQSADTLSTVFFVAGVLCFSAGDKSGRLRFFALGGIALAMACQFRPNLILFPIFMAVIYTAARRRQKGRVKRVLVYLVAFLLFTLPWVVRNYRVSGLFQPTPTHGAFVFWFGSLQVGPYIDNWVGNPRFLFLNPVFDYTIYDHRPLVVEVEDKSPGKQPGGLTRLVYRTDRDAAGASLCPAEKEGSRSTYLIPVQQAPAVVYYYFENRFFSDSGREVVRFYPREGPADPLIFFINKDHLGDADICGDYLDIFDLSRMLRHVSLSCGLPFADRLDFDGDGEVGEADFRLAVGLLSNGRGGSPPERKSVPGTVEISDRADSTVAVFADGSRMLVPHSFSGRITDISFRPGPADPGELDCEATRLLHSRRAFTRIRRQRSQQGVPAPGAARLPAGFPELVLSQRVNAVFYRSEPQEQSRKVALALDNIRRQPLEYLKSRLVQAYRLFVVRGSRDPFTAHQFPASGLIYAVAFLCTLAVFLSMLAGVAVALKRKYSVMILLAPVIYVLLTLGFLQANARFSMAVQPFELVFFAVALQAFLERLGLVPAGEDA
ncbi:MAG: glycosyltransferase family 39 protein [Candidatus Glassbacteria bacterium]|nr:glycosyltransferase family 39 protein [Candidatus Glassbacteria bacterium]